MNEARTMEPAGRLFGTAVGVEALRESLRDDPPRRIVIMTRGHIGDAVMSTGAVRSIAARFPDAHITVETSRRALGVFDHFPIIHGRRARCDRFEKLTSALWLRRSRFDLAIILDDSRRLARVARWGGIRRIVGVRETEREQWLTASVRWDADGHDLFDSLRGVLRLLDAEADIQPRLYPGDADRLAAVRLLERAGQPAVGVFVDAAVDAKRWPRENFLDLAMRLERSSVSTVVLAGPAGDALLQPFSACGFRTQAMPPLLVFAEYIKRLATIVTNDTVAAHLADAAGVPAVVIYGPTSPRRFAPCGSGHRLLHAGFGCDYYLRRCDAQKDGGACDRRCLDAITVDQVFDATIALVQLASAR